MSHETNGKDEGTEKKKEGVIGTIRSILPQAPPELGEFDPSRYSQKDIKKVSKAICRGDWKTVGEISEETKLFEPQIRNTFTYFRRLFPIIREWCIDAYGLGDSSLAFREDKTKKNIDGNHNLKLYCITGSWSVLIDRDLNIPIAFPVFKRKPRERSDDSNGGELCRKD